MRKDRKFIEMIIALVIVGILTIMFFVLLVNYEIKKPSLPKPTPTPTMAPPTNTPTPSSTPTPTCTPTPGYVKEEWDPMFDTVEFMSYVVTEYTTDTAKNITLKNVYKVADGCVYFYKQSTEKEVSEGWNLVDGDAYTFVAGTLTKNKEGNFVVNKNGYKVAKTTQEKLEAQNYPILVNVEGMVIKYHNEIPFEDYLPEEYFVKYKTAEDNQYQSTLTFKNGLLSTMEVEYELKKNTMYKVVIELNTITAADILETNPKK